MELESTGRSLRPRLCSAIQCIEIIIMEGSVGAAVMSGAPGWSRSARRRVRVKIRSHLRVHTSRCERALWGYDVVQSQSFKRQRLYCDVWRFPEPSRGTSDSAGRRLLAARLAGNRRVALGYLPMQYRCSRVRM